MARPSHQPEPDKRRQVDALAGFGITEADRQDAAQALPARTGLGHTKAQCQGGREPVQESNRRRQGIRHCRYGLAAADIACVLATDEDVLKATYEHEPESSALKANARVAESLYRKATGEGRESVTAAIFWLKTRARWKETSIHELQGKLDTSVTFVTTCEDMKLL
ncbi:hypothetical protein NKH36_33790 [Mesorhizobium sp. M1312]|uniref:hypothetical protein n=1 Tax=unclassified Mesorhizobium TaxID=325217 RepID=UPI00333728C3